jgi:phosphatidylethanolamine/phosphatidyl-N-methylethanolamine N-methyltransferase
MELDAIRKAYRRYARLYDLYFGAVFQPGRKAVVQRMSCRRGQRVLEVGVGTGLSLPLYPDDTQVTGIDISPEMLERARARLLRESIGRHIELHVMDAERMSFPSDSFDKVVAMYVVSVVPHPKRLVDEMRRVCKPNGEIYIVNHFHSPNPIVGTAESLLAPLSRLVGFHPDFCLQTFVRDTNLEVADRQPVNLFGYWSLLRARNNKEAMPALSFNATG